MVSVSVDAGWRKDCGQAIEELQGRETQGGAAGRVGFRQDVEDLVGASINQVEAFEGEGRPSAVADEPLKAFAVGGLDPDTGVQAKATPVILAEQVLSIVWLQEAMAAKVAEDPASDRVLEELQELMGEGGGFVEAEVGFWMGGTRIRVILDPLEEPVHDDEMEMGTAAAIGMGMGDGGWPGRRGGRL